MRTHFSSRDEVCSVQKAVTRLGELQESQTSFQTGLARTHVY